jgi:hypothetical protein
MSRKFAIITNARRETMYSTYPSVNPEVKVSAYDYRKGELGMIHPRILDFYSDLEKNLRKSAGKEYGKIQLSSDDDVCIPGSQSFFSATDMAPYPYKQEKDDIPVLMYSLQSRMPTRQGYFIGIFKRGEFSEISRLEITDVKKEAEKICARNKLGSWKSIENMIDETWRHLIVFEVLMKGKFDQIPVEISYKKISQSDVSIQEKLVKDLKENEFRRARSNSPFSEANQAIRS